MCAWCCTHGDVLNAHAEASCMYTRGREIERCWETSTSASASASTYIYVYTHTSTSTSTSKSLHLHCLKLPCALDTHIVPLTSNQIRITPESFLQAEVSLVNEIVQTTSRHQLRTPTEPRKSFQSVNPNCIWALWVFPFWVKVMSQAPLLVVPSQSLPSSFSRATILLPEPQNFAFS